VGVYAPFGLGVKWPQDSGLRSLALDSKLTFLTVNPVLAWKILPSLSVAAGPTFNYAKIEFSRGLATPSDYFRFDGDDYALGMTAGILWQPHPKWSFGANYRLGTTMDFRGSSVYGATQGGPTAYTRADAPGAVPQIISGGISFAHAEMELRGGCGLHQLGHAEHGDAQRNEKPFRLRPAAATRLA